MNDQQLKDFWIQLAGQLTRFLLVTVAGALETHQIITHDQSQQLSSAGVAAQLVIFICFAAPIIWGVAKTRWNVKFPVDAANAPAGTPIEQIKTDSIEKHKFIATI